MAFLHSVSPGTTNFSSLLSLPTLIALLYFFQSRLVFSFRVFEWLYGIPCSGFKPGVVAMGSDKSAFIQAACFRRV